jgi:hypothetical protein
MKFTYSPDALNEPESFTFEATTVSDVQVFVNIAPLQSGDILSYTLTGDMSGASGVATSKQLVPDTETLQYSPKFTVQPEQTVTVTLSQTAGTPREINLEISTIEAES